MKLVLWNETQPTCHVSINAYYLWWCILQQHIFDHTFHSSIFSSIFLLIVISVWYEQFSKYILTLCKNSTALAMWFSKFNCSFVAEYLWRQLLLEAWLASITYHPITLSRLLSTRVTENRSHDHYGLQGNVW